MAAHGPKSTAAKEHEAEFGTVQVFDRPPPPAELTPRQREIWLGTVASVRPDWFRPESLPLLVSYCRHVAESERLSRLCEAAMQMMEVMLLDPQPNGEDGEFAAFDAENFKLTDKLLAAREREDRAALACARSLRITMQATRTADQGRGTGTNGGFAGEKPIWDDY